MVNLDREKFLAVTLALSSAPLLACAPTSTTSATPTTSPAATPQQPPPSQPQTAQPTTPSTTPPPATASGSDGNCGSWAPWGECVAQAGEDAPFFECQQNDPTVEGCSTWRANRPYNGCTTFDAQGKCKG